MPLLPTLAVLLALGAPPAPPEGIAAHAFAWRRTSGGEWVLALTVEPRAGWHVYWQNPGDSGSAPTIELTLPAGWQAGEIVYPRPDVSVHEDEVLYGYESRAQYLVPVRRVPNPAAADPTAVPDAGRPAPWTARAKVMACKERCVMAELSASGDAASGEGAELPRGLSGGVALGRSLPETAEQSVGAVLDLILPGAGVAGAGIIGAVGVALRNGAKRREAEREAARLEGANIGWDERERAAATQQPLPVDRAVTDAGGVDTGAKV